jgi:predicted TIM-barrel fold metal-dependent hydrolase
MSEVSFRDRFDIFDVHHHVGDASSVLGLDAKGVGPSGGASAIAAEMATRIEIMDRGGVRQAAVIPGHGYLRPRGHADTREVNDGIAAYRDAKPERFPIAMGIVEPRDGELSFGEIDRCANELGLAGISFHTRFQGAQIDSPMIARYVERIGAVGMVPVMHALDESTEESLWKVGQLAHRFPDLTLLVLDGYATHEGTKQCGHLADVHENLIFDTSLSHNEYFILEDIKRHGAHRYVFGTDLYSAPLGTRISHILAQLADSDLSDEDKAAVFGGNARRLFGL